MAGHRILAEPGRLTEGVDDALDCVQAAFPAEPLIVVSPLAEGADRLVAHRLLARPGAVLVAALPLPPEDYITDFATAESQAEFQALLRRAVRVVAMAPAATRTAAYEAVGLYILDNCDVLVTVWDGKGPQGQGGTGAIVAEARRRRLPIAWVHAGNRKPGTMAPTSLGDEQGKVTFENWHVGRQHTE